MILYQEFSIVVQLGGKIGFFRCVILTRENLEKKKNHYLDTTLIDTEAIKRPTSSNKDTRVQSVVSQTKHQIDRRKKRDRLHPPFWFRNPFSKVQCLI